MSPGRPSREMPLVISYDKAQRMLVSEAPLKMPGAQAANVNYSTRLFHIGSAGVAKAEITISWQGNAYGEIGTPVVDKDLDKSTGWSHSAAQLTVSKIDRIPVPGVDPRAWPIVFTYTGNYDPWANGFFEFTGEFELNAFGGLKFNRHNVVSRSTVDFTIIGQPEQYVVKGNDVVVPVPAIPQAQIDYLTGKLP
jgi:hypothetical protein